MMGWRVGYLAFPEDGSGSLAAELVKVQDTVSGRPAPLGVLGNACLGPYAAREGCFGPHLHAVSGTLAVLAMLVHILSRERSTMAVAAGCLPQVVVCPTQLSQWVALGALEAGRGWVDEQVHSLEGNRCGGDGAH